MPRAKKPVRRKPAKGKASRRKASSKKTVRALTSDDYLKELQADAKGEKEGLQWGVLSEDLFGSSVKERVPTGSLAVDRLLAGGWPVGRVTELVAWEGVGKSTLVDQSIAQAQRAGGVAALIDTESARDTAYTQKLGVDTDKLIVQPADTVEGCFAAIEKLIKLQEKMFCANNGEVPAMLIVWDSFGGTPTKAEKEKSVEEITVADAARVLKRNLRRMVHQINKFRIALIVTNHFYKSITGGQYAPLNVYGGSGMKYFASARLWLRKESVLKVGEAEVGHVVEAKLKKTRVSTPMPPTHTALVYGSGLDNSYTLFDWGRRHGVRPDHKWVTQHGNWYYLMMPDGSHEAFQRGFVGFGEVLGRRTEVYVQMANQFLGKEPEDGESEESDAQEGADQESGA